VIKPQIIVIDGPDGVGKTTQVHLLAAHLAKTGADVHVARASGGTPIGEELRKASLSLHPRLPETDVYISLAMHTELGHDIQMRKNNGQIIIVDRGPLALLSYNLYGAQLPDRKLAEDAFYELMELWKPDVLIYLDAPQNILDARRQQRGNNDYFENKDSDFHHRVRRGYEAGIAMLKKQPGLIHTLHEVDANQPPEAIFTQIKQTVAR